MMTSFLRYLWMVVLFISTPFLFAGPVDGVYGSSIDSSYKMKVKDETAILTYVLIEGAKICSVVETWKLEYLEENKLNIKILSLRPDLACEIEMRPPPIRGIQATYSFENSILSLVFKHNDQEEVRKFYTLDTILNSDHTQF